MFIETLTPALSQHGICTAFTRRVPVHQSFFLTHAMKEDLRTMSFFFNKTKATICIIHADIQTMGTFNTFLFVERISIGKVWIMTAHWDSTSQIMMEARSRKLFHGSFSFAVHSPEMPEFQKVLHRLYADWKKEQFLLPYLSEGIFNCSLPNFKDRHDNNESCSEVTPEDIPETLMSTTRQSYRVYSAAYAIAHALHAMLTSRTRTRRMETRDQLEPLTLQPWQVGFLSTHLFPVFIIGYKTSC